MVPPLLATTAMAVLDELQVACAVTLRVELSVNTAVAVNCRVACTGMLGLVGVTCTKASGGSVTFKVALASKPPWLAPMVALPTAIAVTTPPPPPPGPPPPPVDTVATDASDELHVAAPVTTVVVPSLHTTVATK